MSEYKVANVNSAFGEKHTSPLEQAVRSWNCVAVKELLKRGEKIAEISLDFERIFEISQDRELITADTTLNVFEIMQILREEGLKITVDHLKRMLKYLTASPNIHDADIFGSVLEKCSKTVIECYVRDMTSNFTYYPAEMRLEQSKIMKQALHKYLTILQAGNFYIDGVDTAYLFNFILEIFEDVDVTALSPDTVEEIELEIIELKNTVVYNKVSLLDLCRKSPEQSLRLMNFYNVWSIGQLLRSKNIDSKFPHTAGFIKGHIAKMLISGITQRIEEIRERKMNQTEPRTHAIKWFRSITEREKREMQKY